MANSLVGCQAILPKGIAMKKSSRTDKNPKGKVSAHKESQFNMSIKSGATRAERKEIGRSAREKAPLESHAELHIPKSGRDIL